MWPIGSVTTSFGALLHIEVFEFCGERVSISGRELCIRRFSRHYKQNTTLIYWEEWQIFALRETYAEYFVNLTNLYSTSAPSFFNASCCSATWGAAATTALKCC